MGTLRTIALGILWLLAAVGVACGVVWGLTAAGLIKPLVVISGSMEPGIMTGDLLVDTRVAASSLAVGDVVSLPSELTHNLVTHRITDIAVAGDGGYTIALKGDANEFGDALDYSVAGDVWHPWLQLPGAGAFITRMTTPAVSVPLLAGLVGLIGIVWMVPAPVRSRRLHAAKAADGARVPAVAAMGSAEAAGALTRRELRLRQGATA
jgi:signal peptidase I